jgi:lysyl oxidase-like protein 2/3/4
MEVFATFDVMDSKGVKVAEGHKASFCLEDNQCMPGVKPFYACANFGDQGISVNCSDIYRHNIDCQWVDISELNPGIYTFKVSYLTEDSSERSFFVSSIRFDITQFQQLMLWHTIWTSLYTCIISIPSKYLKIFTKIVYKFNKPIVHYVNYFCFCPVTFRSRQSS